MGKLANSSGKNAVKAFIEFGYTHIHTSGDHAILQKASAPTLSIPLHKEVAPYLLRSQIKKSGLSIEKFMELLKK